MEFVLCEQSTFQRLHQRKVLSFVHISLYLQKSTRILCWVWGCWVGGMVTAIDRVKEMITLRLA